MTADRDNQAQLSITDAQKLIRYGCVHGCTVILIFILKLFDTYVSHPS
jgi:hypothetical protein